MDLTVIFFAQEGDPGGIGYFVFHYFIAPILTLLYRLIVGNWVYVNISIAVYFIIKLWLNTIKWKGLWSYSTCVILGTICAGLSICLICYTPFVMELEAGFNLWLKRTAWDYMDWNEGSLFLSTSLAIIFLFCSFICTIHQGCWISSDEGGTAGSEPPYRISDGTAERERPNPIWSSTNEKDSTPVDPVEGEDSNPEWNFKMEKGSTPVDPVEGGDSNPEWNFKKEKDPQLEALKYRAKKKKGRKKKD
jgi:hypothetical protein